MIQIKETNPERIKFIKDICSARKINLLVFKESIIINHIDTSKVIEMSYENWIGENFERGIVTNEVGSMRIVNGRKEVLLPTAIGSDWYPLDCMPGNVTIRNSENPTKLETILGLSHSKKGYFSIEDRTVLYKSSWKKIKVTKEEIAEKFNCSPSQLIIV